MQEEETDKDKEHCKKVHNTLNNIEDKPAEAAQSDPAMTAQN